MNNNQFNYSNFFKNTGLYTQLLSESEVVWDVLPKIDDFIRNFKSHSEAKEYNEISENVFIGKNVSIDDTARIVSGAIIGHNSSIGHAAFLRGEVLVGENVHIGHATEVKHSIILSGTALAHLNYVGDSMVGSDVNISGGATLANWRFDKKNIQIKLNDEIFETNMEKMGAILGDRCFIGVNSVLNPGTILAQDSLVYPLVSVKGVHLATQTFKK